MGVPICGCASRRIPACRLTTNAGLASATSAGRRRKPPACPRTAVRCGGPITPARPCLATGELPGELHSRRMRPSAPSASGLESFGRLACDLMTAPPRPTPALPPCSTQHGAARLLCRQRTTPARPSGGTRSMPRSTCPGSLASGGSITGMSYGRIASGGVLAGGRRCRVACSYPYTILISVGSLHARPRT